MPARGFFNGPDERGPDAAPTVILIDDESGEPALRTRAIDELEDVKCRETDELSLALGDKDIRVPRGDQSLEPWADVAQIRRVAQLVE